MKKQKSKKNNKNRTLAEVIGAGAAVAATLYFLYGTKKGAKSRKRFKGWMLMMKGEVANKAENIKDLTEESYKRIVDQTSRKFKKMKKVSASEVSALAEDLKKHWKEIVKEAQESPAKTKTAKKSKTKSKK